MMQLRQQGWRQTRKYPHIPEPDAIWPLLEAQPCPQWLESALSRPYNRPSPHPSPCWVPEVSSLPCVSKIASLHAACISPAPGAAKPSARAVESAEWARYPIPTRCCGTTAVLREHAAPEMCAKAIPDRTPREDPECSNNHWVTNSTRRLPSGHPLRSFHR